jgi:hypothetical protein
MVKVPIPSGGVLEDERAAAQLYAFALSIPDRAILIFTGGQSHE